MVFYKKLEGHIPEDVFDELLLVSSKFNINSPLRLAHFLAQCHHESGGFKHTEENLKYSANGLFATYKKYFPTLESAKPYQYDPVRIANKVYADRLGNGPVSSGDGWTYRGRGYIQLTGKYNYELFSKEIPDNVVLNPDLVKYKYPLLSAAWFYVTLKNLNVVADLGDSEQVIAKITKKINGGLNGQKDRVEHFKMYYPLLKNTEKEPDGSIPNKT